MRRANIFMCGSMRRWAYMASFKNLCERIGVDFDEFFKADSEAELYHFIGKDILYFHALFGRPC